MHPVHDHVDTALALLVQQFQDKERIRSLLGALVSQVQGVEDTLWDLHIARRLARAAGAQLDGIGRIVGLRRGRLSEESYRTYLRAQIRLLRSHGTPEDLLAMVSLIVGPEVSVELDEYQIASVVLGLRGTLDDAVVDDVVALVGAAKPAGVRAIVESSKTTGVFIFDSDLESESWGDVHDSSTGGIFGSARNAP